jgi:ribosomal protein S12 methylthiotransferase accessory factor
MLEWLATERDRSKVRLPGTDRALPPAATLEPARRAAAKVGVTRVADITRLDVIGIPTFQAVRPASRTLAVSQGKGTTPDLARLSAMMESVETWHVEQDLPPVATAPSLGLALGYDPGDLPAATPSLWHDRLPLGWLAARSLLDGSDSLAPRDMVHLTLEARDGWNAPAFFQSTNGLASGNTRVEAALHALYEVIERDAMTAAVRRNDFGVAVAPGTLGSAVADELCGLIERAGVTVELRFVPSATGLPVFLSWIACDDYPAAMFGFGCHLSPEIAATRAITEAAQTRLGYIAGARDDLHENIDVVKPRQKQARTSSVRDVAAEAVSFDSLAEDLGHVVKAATAAFGHAPLLVDLTREEIGVAVVKVVAPGARICREVS